MEHEWPLHVKPPTGPEYPWPYDVEKLIAERELVQHMANVCASFEKGYRVKDKRIFTVPFTFDDCFIESHCERVILEERVRHFHNTEWRRDATTLAHARPDFFMDLKTNAGHIFERLMENVMLLHALTEKLKPETRTLAGHCQNFAQLHRFMRNAGV
jgi:hypothetical protein